MNSIQVIVPYKYNGQWVFDDADKGIKREAFVGGTDDILYVITFEIPHAEDGFSLIFSDRPFKGYSHVFTYMNAEHSGYNYLNGTLGKGWLCSVINQYFDSPPVHLYVQVKGK